MSLIETDVNINLQGVQDKLNNAINSSETMTEVHKAYADIINPWIPYRTGQLADKDVRIEPSGVTYYAPWASRNYYGDDIRHNPTYHPLATAHWDKVAMQTEREAFAQQVKEIIMRRYNNG